MWLAYIEYKVISFIWMSYKGRQIINSFNHSMENKQFLDAVHLFKLPFFLVMSLVKTLDDVWPYLCCVKTFPNIFRFFVREKVLWATKQHHCKNPFLVLSGTFIFKRVLVGKVLLCTFSKCSNQKNFFMSKSTAYIWNNRSALVIRGSILF